MGLMKKLTSVLVASSLVLGSVGFALADTTGSVQDAYSRLEGYKLVAGVPDENGIPVPALDAPVTRAQLATVIVRAFGHEETAGYLKGTSSFSDVAANAWYSGYVAMIKNLSEKNGIAVGYEDGSFRPEKQVSAIEALAFLMKVLGIQPGTGATWAQDTLRIAIDNGLITEADAEAYLSDLNAPASRGLAFAIVDAVFRTATVDGKTLYQVYVDDEAPVLVVDQPAEPTTTKAGDTITGNVKGAEALYLGSEAITVDEEGNFSVEVTFELGENEFVFTAVDAAGNVAEASYKVTRVAGEAAAVVVELGDGTIQAGSEAELVFKLVDANGAEVEYNAEDVKVTIGGEIGSYDKETGIFTASKKAGSGTITVTIGDLSGTAEIKVVPGPFAKVGADKESAAPGEKIQLSAQDEFGNVIEGATFSVDSADALVDSTKGIFVATKAGTYTVTATIGDESKTLEVGVYAAADHLVIEAPATILANDSSTVEVKVKVVDKNGNLVGNAKNVVTLSGDGLIADSAGLTKQAVNGVATFKIKTVNGATIAGGIIPLTATASGLGNGTAEIEAVPQVATSVGFVNPPKYVSATSAGIQTATIQARVLDQDGKPMKSGVYGVRFSLTGPGYFTDSAGSANYGTALANTVPYLGSSSTPNATTYIRATTGYTGDIVVTASVDGVGSATHTVASVVPTTVAGITATVDANTNPGTAGYLPTVSGSTGTPIATSAGGAAAVKVTLQLVDTNGVPMPAPSGLTSVFVDLDKVSTELMVLQSDSVTPNKVIWQRSGSPATTTQNYVEFSTTTGQATLMVYAKKFVGDLNLTIKDYKATNALSSATATVSMEANEATKFAVTQRGFYLPITNTEGKVTVQLYDEYGNKAGVAGKTFRFTKANIDGMLLNGSAANWVEVTTDANGQASVDVKMPSRAGTYANAITVTTTDWVDPTDTSKGTIDPMLDSSSQPMNTVSITVDYAVPAVMTARVVNFTAPATITNVYTTTTTDPVYLFVQVRDNYGSFMTDAQLADARFHLDDESAKQVQGSTTFTFIPALNGWLAGPFTIKAPGLASLKVVSDDAANISGTGRVSVQSTQVASVTLVEAFSKPGSSAKHVAMQKDVMTSFTLQLRDSFNNPVVVQSDTTVTVSYTNSDPTEYLEIRTSSGGRNVLVGGTGTITVPAGASSVTIYVLANPGNDNKVTFTLQVGSSTTTIEAEF